MSFIFGNTMDMSAKSLDFLWQKQTVIRNNIANVDTPGYKSKYVTFEEDFSRKLKAADKAGTASRIGQAIQTSGTTVHNTRSESTRLDGNNVQEDVESVELARTGIQYQYVIQTLNSDIARMTTVIKG